MAYGQQQPPPPPPPQQQQQGYQQPPPPQQGYQQPPPPGYGQPPQQQSDGKWGMIAGIMMLIGAIVGLAYGAYMLYIVTAANAVTGGMMFAMGGAWLYLCAILPLLGGIFGILGAVFSFKREKWALCLVASILVLLGSWFIFGLLALIFLVLGKDEFH